MTQILASLDDINTNLDQVLVEADDDNTELIQISVSRIIRGFFNTAIENTILQSWRAPEVTPDIIREAAGKLIAAQHYYNEISKTTNIIEADSYAQKLYDQGMMILNGILSGAIGITDPITETPITSSEGMSDLDYFPTDSTDRAFTMGMQL